MPVLVSDTSVLIDLERGEVLEAAFRLQDTLVVPDLLYDQELKSESGPRLLQLGLRVERLPPETVTVAVVLRRDHPTLSVPDCFALALAESQRWPLLTGDGTLRALAERRQLECHGVLWLFDRMHVESVVPPAVLHACLTALAAHPRCRLPRADVAQRLATYV